MDTPEFLLWAIGYRCPVRGFQDGSDPEKAERQLRAARAVSDARREGRIADGYCLDPPYGFRIEEALAVYGGLHVVEQCCGDCPANTNKAQDKLSLAGCYGLFPLAEPLQFSQAIEHAAQRVPCGPQLDFHFESTRPRWYGFFFLMIRRPP